MDNKELQKIVNPVYTTAKGTLLLLMAAGDRDALALAPFIEIKFDKKGSGVPPLIWDCYKTAQSARYEINNNAAIRSGAPIVVDLPSGYSPRGFRVAAAGKRYFGFDLPVVIGDMGPAAGKVMTGEQRRLATYHAVDATNYESMKAALGDVKGELCIVTEGMLGYFNDSELASMCHAIHRLLSEYGGCWKTADLSIIRIYALTFGALYGGDENALQERMHQKAGDLSDVKINQNSLFLGGDEGARKFLSEQGFTIVSEPLCDYLPDNLPGLDASRMQTLREGYARMEMLTLRPQKKSPLRRTSAELPFAVETSLSDGTLLMKVQGRVDTLTATDMLSAFQLAPSGYNSIDVEAGDLCYISSAGLRVLLIMMKAVRGRGTFRMLNLRPEVMKILSITGFDKLLC